MDELLDIAAQPLARAPRALAALLKKRGINLFGGMPILPCDRAGRLPLSHAQERLWFLAQLDPDSGAYNIAEAVRLQGPLDLEALQRSLDALVARHEVLRTTFPAERRPGPAAHPRRRARCASIAIDLQPRLPPEPSARRARRLASAEADAPFDLARARCCGSSCWRLGDADHVLLVTMHHIVSDGWSMEIAHRRAGRACTPRGSRAARPRPAGPADPVRRLRRLAARAGSRRASASASWRTGASSWATSTPVLELPADRAAARRCRATAGATRSFDRRRGAWRPASSAWRRAHGATLFMVLLAAFKALLLPLHRAARSAGGRAGRQPRPRRDRAAWSASSSTPRCCAAEVDGRRALRRVAGAGAGSGAGRAGPPGSAVRAAGRGAAARAQPGPQPPVPGDVQPPAARSYGALGRLPGLRCSRCRASSPTTQFDLSLDTDEDDAGRLHGALTYATDLFDGPPPRAVGALLACWPRWWPRPTGRSRELELLSPPTAAQSTTWNTAPGRRTPALAPESVRPTRRAPRGRGHLRGPRVTYGDLAAAHASWRASGPAGRGARDGGRRGPRARPSCWWACWA